jgi:rhamnosyl/mannosyltransferase
VPCYGQLLYAPVSPSFPSWFHRAIGQFKPDILHLHMPNTSAFWALMLPRARRVPWVVQWHSDVVPSRLDRRLVLAYKLYRPLEKQLLKRADAIVATSPTYLDSSTPLQPWLSKCRVIPLGLNAERFTHVSPPNSLWANGIWGENNAVRLLAVGRLTYYKGYDVLIQAVARSSNLRLVIVGAGECRGKLENLIRALNLESQISLVGLLEEQALHALFASCDIFCLPSLERTEAFGLVLLEAMQFRKPVVASHIPGSGVGWVVQQGRHGILVPPGDIGALARALGLLANDPAKRARLGHMAQISLEKLFGIEAVANQINTLYEGITRTP